jgi:hypothetical protein
MANGHGGARRGAGRPPGTRNRRRHIPLEELRRVRISPLERLLDRIEDEGLDAKYRDMLCIAVLPFVHARPVATLTAKCSFEMTDDEINAVIAREEAYQRGEIAQVIPLRLGHRRR